MKITQYHFRNDLDIVSLSHGIELHLANYLCLLHTAKGSKTCGRFTLDTFVYLLKPWLPFAYLCQLVGPILDRTFAQLSVINKRLSFQEADFVIPF